MKTLVFSQSFKRAYKTFIKRNPDLPAKISEKLKLLAIDPYNASLRTHCSAFFEFDRSRIELVRSIDHHDSLEIL